MKIEEHPIMGECYRASLKIEPFGVDAVKVVDQLTTSARRLVADALLLREGLKALLIHTSGSNKAGLDKMMESATSGKFTGNPAVPMAILALVETIHLES